jgi:hypothetical protein
MTKSSSSTWKTMIAAIVTTALAGTALFLAAGSGGASEPKRPEVAYQSGSGSSERIEAMKARIEKTRARIAGLDDVEAQPDPEPTATKKPPKKPRRPKPDAKPDPDPKPPIVYIDPECLKNPLCVK